MTATHGRQAGVRKRPYTPCHGEVHLMIAAISGGLVVILSVAVVRWVVSVPLIRTLSASIDCWADSVQGQDA
jgi:hypothetical protein